MMYPERNVNVWVKFHGNPSKHFWNFILWNKEMNCRPQDTGSWLIAGFPYWTRYKYHNNDLKNKKKNLAHFCGYVFVRPTTIPDLQQRNTECLVLCPGYFRWITALSLSSQHPVRKKYFLLWAPFFKSRLSRGRSQFGFALFCNVLSALSEHCERLTPHLRGAGGGGCRGGRSCPAIWHYMPYLCLNMQRAPR